MRTACFGVSLAFPLEETQKRGSYMKKRLFQAGAFLILVFGAIQLIPLDQTNPPVEEDIQTPHHIKVILKQACYDCHSHETVWPWYSNMAPVSWLLIWDVRKGREELNFSTWNRYNPTKQKKFLREIWEEVEEGEMPPWFYLPLHPDSFLSAHDRQQIKAWATSGSQGMYKHDDNDSDEHDES